MGRVLPDLIQNRRLLVDLVWKELRARYRNAAMGFIWAVLQPVLMMAVLTVVFGYLARDIVASRSTGHSYAVFLLCALVPWQFFSAALTQGTQSLHNNGALIKKVYFPREVIPLAAVLNCLVNVVIGFVTLAVVMAVLDGASALGIGWAYLPLILFIQIMLVVGLAMLFSAWNVHYHDVAYMLEVALAFGFYASPIIYALPSSMSALPVSESTGTWLYRLYMLNPMAGLITLYRQALLENRFPDLNMLGLSACLAAMAFTLGVYLFRRNAPTFADHL